MNELRTSGMTMAEIEAFRAKGYDIDEGEARWFCMTEADQHAEMNAAIEEFLHAPRCEYGGRIPEDHPPIGNCSCGASLGVPRRSRPEPQSGARYGRRALESEVGRVVMAPEGSRNHQLNASAFSLGQLVAGGVLDGDEVAQALYTAAMRSGLTDTEAVKTIRSGMTSGTQNPRAVPSVPR